MPTDVLALPLGSLNTKWKEPYASASLNQRFVGIVAPGIYRGLLLADDPGSGDRTIVVQADSDKQDHVAVYENADGYSISYRDSTSGDITLSLAAYASTTVVISLYVSYAPGQATTGFYRVFTTAEFDVLGASVKDHLVVLGTVVVPASGPISLGSISLQNRTLASTNLSRGTIPNAPVVRNPGFEAGEVNATHARSSLFWDKSITVGTGTWKTVSAPSPIDTGMKSIELNVTSGPVSGEISQQVGVPTQEGELFLISLRVKQLKTIVSGTLTFFMEWSDVNDALLSTTTVSLDGGVVDTAFRTVSTIIAAPAGASSLRAVGARATLLDPSTPGAFGYIDNIDVLVEPADPTYPYPFDLTFRRALAGTALSLSDKTTNFAGLAAGLRFDQSTPSGEGRVLVEPYNSANLPPALQLLGRIYKLGAGLLNTDANSLKPRISWDNGESVQRTLLWEAAGDAAGIPALRQYVSSGGYAELTANAMFDGTNWVKDQNGQEAFKFSLSKFGITQYYQIAGTNTWVDVGWVAAFDLTSSGINSSLTLTANNSITISGTGQYKHGIRTKVINWVAGMPLNSSSTAPSLNGSMPDNRYIEWTPLNISIPCAMEIGERIVNVRGYIRDNATGPTRVTMEYFAPTIASTGAIGNITSSGTAGTDQTLSATAINHTLVSGEQFYVHFYSPSGTGATRLYRVEVDYDHP
jgi:hypothetical protein